MFDNRRFTKRIYIPLPEPATRAALITHLMQKQQQQGGKPVPARVIQRVVHMTEGYSGSDLTAVSILKCAIRTVTMLSEMSGK